MPRFICTSFAWSGSDICCLKNSIGIDVSTNVITIFSKEVETQIWDRLPKVKHRSQGLLPTLVVKCLYDCQE